MLALLEEFIWLLFGFHDDDDVLGINNIV